MVGHRNFGLRPLYEPPPLRAPLWLRILSTALGAVMLLAFIASAFIAAHALHALMGAL
jgi:hypothetical protein